jgi:hypothetical protein
MTSKGTFTDDDLEAAGAAGVVDARALAALRAFLEARRAPPAGAEEAPRLVSGLGDVLVTVAAGLLLGALGGVLGLVNPALGLVGAGAAAWALSPLVALKRRLALPSILCALAAVGSAWGLAALLLAPLADERPILRAATLLGAGLAGAGAAVVHWRLFRVPATVAAGAAAGAAGIVGALVLGADAPRDAGIVLGLSFVLGLACFAMALRWDGRDLLRRGLSADVAFWLHLLAAPMLVHPVFAQLDLMEGTARVGAALAAIGLYLVLGGVALLIDRRAFLLAGLVYLVVAVVEVFRSLGGTAGWLPMGLAVLVTGGGLLVLGLAWTPTRRRALACVPEPWARRLPPAP